MEWQTNNREIKNEPIFAENKTFKTKYWHIAILLTNKRIKGRGHKLTLNELYLRMLWIHHLNSHHLNPLLIISTPGEHLPSRGVERIASKTTHPTLDDIHLHMCNCTINAWYISSQHLRPINSMIYYMRSLLATLFIISLNIVHRRIFATIRFILMEMGLWPSKHFIKIENPQDLESASGQPTLGRLS